MGMYIRKRIFQVVYLYTLVTSFTDAEPLRGRVVLNKYFVVLLVFYSYATPLASH